MSDDRLTLRFVVSGEDAGDDGEHATAGRVLGWIDEAAALCASRWSHLTCHTAYIGNAHFTAPIRVGQIVEVGARIVSTGRTSVQLIVAVSATSPTDPVPTSATHCLIVVVAADAEGNTTQVPTWHPTSLLQLDLQDRALRRTEVRWRITRAMAAQNYTESGTTPQLVARFVEGSAGDDRASDALSAGSVLRWIDAVSERCATDWAGMPTTAVYAGGMQFRQRVPLGTDVEVAARVIHSTRRSLHVAARVTVAHPTGRAGHRMTVAECLTVAVVVGPDRRAIPVPQLLLQSDEDRRLDQHAQQMMSIRSELEAIGEPDDLLLALEPLD